MPETKPLEPPVVVQQEQPAEVIQQTLPPGVTQTSAPGLPERDSKGKLTRRGMEHVIAAGGSVLHGGRSISKLHELPSAADLAKGNAALTESTRDALLAERDRLDRELAKLADKKTK